jgi:hypothetical protein
LLNLSSLDDPDKLVVRRSMLGLADLLGQNGPLDLGLFPHSRLSEHRQQHDGLAGREPVGNAHGRAIESGSELTDTVAEVAGVRFAQQRSLFSKQADVLLDLQEVLGGRLSSQAPTSGSSSIA